MTLCLHVRRPSQTFLYLEVLSYPCVTILETKENIISLKLSAIFAAILCTFVSLSPCLLYSTGNIPIEGITVNGRKREEEIVKRKEDKKITGLVKR